MKKVLITGAAGSLGQALREVLTTEEQYKDLYEVIATGTREDKESGILKLDITDEQEVGQFFLKMSPDYVINCAAYTAVDLCEDEKEAAYAVNVKGPENLAKAAQHIGTVMFHISTDYVFAGDGTRPYTEEDETNPVSAYGKTKRMGEEAVQKNCSKYFILRTAWLYGAKKSFVKIMLKLADSGKPVSVVNDQKGSPTSALELARVIAYLMPSKQYGIINTTCQGETTWYEFAKYIFECVGKNVEVIPISTKEYPTKAVRPAYSVLDNTKLYKDYGYQLADWKSALQEYLK